MLVILMHVLGDLNPDPWPPHLTSTYTCGVTIAPRVYSGHVIQFLIFIWRKHNMHAMCNDYTKSHNMNTNSGIINI